MLDRKHASMVQGGHIQRLGKHNLSRNAPCPQQLECAVSLPVSVHQTAIFCQLVSTCLQETVLKTQICFTHFYQTSIDLPSNKLAGHNWHQQVGVGIAQYALAFSHHQDQHRPCRTFSNKLKYHRRMHR